jgi:hypothetical protein
VRRTTAGAIAAAVISLSCSSGGPDRPKPPPPRVVGAATSPPPAWIATERGDYWLEFSNFCWRTACLDFILPQHRPGPVRTVRKLEPVQFHLAFIPTSLWVTVGSKRFPLPPKATTTWRVRAGGVTLLHAKARPGTAEYLVRFRIR